MNINTKTNKTQTTIKLYQTHKEKLNKQKQK